MHNLTEGQQEALTAFNTLILDPDQNVLVVEGHAGTGKTFLVNEMIRQLPKTMKMAKLITANKMPHDMVLTATTNKAATNLREATGCPSKTIHQLLSLRPVTNYATGKTVLEETRDAPIENTIIIIDEASFIDSNLLEIILRRCWTSKICMIGDPAQLLNPNGEGPSVFGVGFITARLTEIVRQAEGNPIIELASSFRDVVNGLPWPQVHLSEEICHVTDEEFAKQVEAEFTDAEWNTDSSKILAHTNKTVQLYNKAVRQTVTGDTKLKVGDFLINNSFVKGDSVSIPTDAVVKLIAMSPGTQHGVKGNFVYLNYDGKFFMPSVASHKAKIIKELKATKQYTAVRNIYDTWIDLRSPYASTVYKAQGSTYKKVFIDLNDIGKKCKDPNQMARLLYVAVSRASEQVILTGDIAN